MSSKFSISNIEYTDELSNTNSSKGDILVNDGTIGTTGGIFQLLAVGNNDEVLTADSTVNTFGMKWDPICRGIISPAMFYFDNESSPHSVSTSTGVWTLIDANYTENSVTGADWDQPNNGEVRWLNATSTYFTIYYCVSGFNDSNNKDVEVYCRFYKDTGSGFTNVPGTFSGQEWTYNTTREAYHEMTGTALVSLDQNDKIAVYIQNATDNNDLSIICASINFIPNFS